MLGVDAHEVSRLRAALAMFVADVFASVPRRDQRAKGECCLRGLMLDGRRKSIQPMAERLPDGNMQALQQFVNQSPWDGKPFRRRIAERLCGTISPEVWIVDDVSFLKCGKAPVVVADAGYGVSTPFRLGLEKRGLSYVPALNGKEAAHPEDVEPHRPTYGGLGPPALPRYRIPPRAVPALAAETPGFVHETGCRAGAGTCPRIVGPGRRPHTGGRAVSPSATG